MTHIGLFEGIGGFSLDARWMGWETIAWCEWNPFCQKILTKHFPEAKQYGDITKTDFTIYRGQCDILTGGFPCQPFSGAGEQLGEKHQQFLLHEMFRSISEIMPRWIVAENVYGITSPKFKRILTEIYSFLEDKGYCIQSYNIPASAVGSDSERQRIFFVAYNSEIKLNAIVTENSKVKKSEFDPEKWCKDRGQFELVEGPGDTRIGFYNGEDFEPTVIRETNDVPFQLDELEAYGNAVNPVVVYNIFKSIQQYEQSNPAEFDTFRYSSHPHHPPDPCPNQGSTEIPEV